MFKIFKSFGFILMFLVSNVQNDCIYSGKKSTIELTRLSSFEIDFYIPIKWGEESLIITNVYKKFKLSNPNLPHSKKEEIGKIIQINANFAKLGWNKIIVERTNQLSLKINDTLGNIWYEGPPQQTLLSTHKTTFSIFGLFSIINCHSDKKVFKISDKNFTIPLIFKNGVSLLSFNFQTKGNPQAPQTFVLKAKFLQKILSVCPIYIDGVGRFVLKEICSSRELFGNYAVYYGEVYLEKLFEEKEYIEIGEFALAQIEIEIINFKESNLIIKTSSYGIEKQQHTHFNHTQITAKSDNNDIEEDCGVLIISVSLLPCLAFIGMVACCVLFIKKKLKPKLLDSSKLVATNQERFVDGNQRVSEENYYRDIYELENPHYVSFDVRNLQTSSKVSSLPESSINQ